MQENGADLTGVVQQRQVDQGPAKTGERPVVREFPFTRKPDLQAYLLAISGGKFPDKAPTQEELKQKLGQGIEKRHDWKTLNELSFQERLNDTAAGKSEKSAEAWKAKFKAWYDYKAGEKGDYFNDLQAVLQALDVTEVSDASLQQLLDSCSSKTENKLDAFVLKIVKNLPDYGKKIQAIQDLASTLFGKEISLQIVSQIVDLEQQVKDTKGEDPKLTTLAQTLAEAAQKPSEERDKFMADAKALHEQYKANHPEPVVDSQPTTNPEVKLAEAPPGVEVLTGGVGHPEQQLAGDGHSVGGDYWLTYKDEPTATDAVRKIRGNAHVLMDTATEGGNIAETAKFAQAFMKHYYDPAVSFSDPQQTAKEAFEKAKAEAGAIPATFTYVVKTENKAYGGRVGNTSAKVVRADGSSEYLADPTGQSSNALRRIEDKKEWPYTGNDMQEVPDDVLANFKTHPDLYEKVSPTVLVVSSSAVLKQTEQDLQSGDYIIMHTDGIKPVDYNKDALTQLMAQQMALEKKGDDSILLIIG